MRPTPGCRRGLGGGRAFSLQKAISASSGLRTTSPELRPRSRASLGNTIRLVGSPPPPEESSPSCPPHSPFVFPTSSTGRAVVGYIPEGRLTTAGEGKPGSWAPEASGQRGEGGTGRGTHGGYCGGRRMRARGKWGSHGPRVEQSGAFTNCLPRCSLGGPIHC